MSADDFERRLQRFEWRLLRIEERFKIIWTAIGIICGTALVALVNWVISLAHR